MKDVEAKDDEPTKKSGKRRKQMARKGLHTSVDKNDSKDSDEVGEQEESITGTKTLINPVPVAMKTPCVATYKIIKQGEKGVYQIVREDGTDIVYINFGAMLKSISRDDLTELYRIVMNRYGMDGPEDELERVFWKYLKNMFEEPLSTDPIWSEVGQQKIISWRYYESCRENEFADDFMDVLNDEESLPKVSLDDMNVDEQEEKLIDTVKVIYYLLGFTRMSKKRKKSDMKTNYVLRSTKERKKRLAMALESPFGQQPPTTPVPPKRISRSVNCDFILPPDFEEDVSGQPKMRSINEIMTMKVFVEQLSRPQNCKKDKVSLPDGLAEYLQMKDPPNYQFPWGYRDIPVDREFWLVLACGIIVIVL
ncbi:hypothetical protein Tco_0747844 [Tanacetum coccineum]|uniref:Uncharacterized protein n=1 Tax=Tanacetum coccineum TaxID=301880 RepID=A0ABQ4YWX5_9ASTR